MKNERWSTLTEIKRALTPDTDKAAGGSILWCKNGRHLKYTGEGHEIILGVSGAGKTRRCSVPMLISFINALESFFVVDPKGDLYGATASRLGNRYNVRVLDFRNIYESACVNLLSAPAELYRSGDPVKKQIAMEMVDQIAHTLYPVSEKADPFWGESARSVFIAAVLALFEYADEDEINMASVYQFIARGDERHTPGGTYLKTFVDKLPPDSIAAMLLQSYVTTASDTRAGIRSTFMEGLSMFARSEGLVSMMGSDDLHINQLDGETPTAIYLILPDESEIYDSIATVIISQLMGHYIRLAQDKYNGRLPRRVNFLVEEAGNVGTISALGHLLSAGRSRNVRCHLVLQNYSQLDRLYGSAEATTIRSNADVLIAFRTNNWETLQELSHKCGERTVEYNGHLTREPLITPSALAAMETGQALVMISGATKFITWLPDYTEMFDCGNHTSPKYKGASSRRAAKTFDIKSYIAEQDEKERKKEHAGRRGDTLSSRRNPFSAPPLFDSGNPFESVFGSPSSDSAVDLAPDVFVPEADFGIDEIRARIDARIAELKAEEAKESAANAHKPYDVLILGDGGNRIKVAKALKDAAGMSVSEAAHIISDLPYNVTFSTLEEAKKVSAALTDAGAQIITSF